MVACQWNWEGDMSAENFRSILSLLCPLWGWPVLPACPARTKVTAERQRADKGAAWWDLGGSTYQILADRTSRA